MIMKKFSTSKKIILATLCTSILFPIFTTAHAKPYKSNTDTGTDIFDYIENRRRERRANELTDEQKKLLADIAENKERLPHAVDENAPIPAVFEGDDMIYNTATGEFTAVGKVDIIQLDGHRFQSEKATGNTKTQDIFIEDKGHVLQLTKGAPRVTLDGYHTVYNYGTKMGTMDSATGKYGEYYISGKRFEFYPDHIVVRDATQTKCNAKNPDYHLSSERMEIWPEQIIRMYNVKLWIKDKVVGKKAYEERTMDDAGENYFPRVGYDKNHGAYISDTFELFHTKDNHFSGALNAYIESKKGVRSNAEAYYRNRNVEGNIYYGYYCDSNDNWIMKEPSLELKYLKHFPTLPLTYLFQYEVGRWKDNRNKTLHQRAEIGLYHDPIVLFKNYYLLLHASYTLTRDNVRSATPKYTNDVNGFNYDITLGREFNDRLAMFTGYHFTKNNSKNSMFDYGNDSYSKKLQAGVSYRITPLDRVVAGVSYNMEDSSLQDVDYYWFHDLHCSTAVIRWRQKRKQWGFQWQFTPW